MSRKKLVLIDGNAIIHRAYHAMPMLTTPSGEPVNAVYGFTSMLLKIINDLKPTHLAVCFDTPEPTFRHKKYKKYQSQRSEADKELKSQFEKVRKVVEALGIDYFEKNGYEADDLIGTIAKKATRGRVKSAGKIRKAGNAAHGLKSAVDQVVIVTGDKDILQLIDENIYVYLPVKGLSTARLMKRDDVKEELGVWPQQVVDLKAFMGDQSDNYPGVYGIGPKTAVKLLSDHGSFEEVYQNLGDYSGGLEKRLKEGKDGGKISKDLAKIVTNVKIPIDYEKMTKWDLNSDKVDRLFSEFGFRTLRKRMRNLAKKKIAEKQMKLI